MTELACLFIHSFIPAPPVYLQCSKGSRAQHTSVLALRNLMNEEGRWAVCEHTEVQWRCVLGMRSWRVGLREGEWLLQREGTHRRKRRQPQSSTCGNVQPPKWVFVQLTNKRACRASLSFLSQSSQMSTAVYGSVAKAGDGPSLGRKLGLSSGGSRCLVAGPEVARAGSSPSPVTHGGCGVEQPGVTVPACSP